MAYTVEMSSNIHSSCLCLTRRWQRRSGSWLYTGRVKALSAVKRRCVLAGSDRWSSGLAGVFGFSFFSSLSLSVLFLRRFCFHGVEVKDLSAVSSESLVA